MEKIKIIQHQNPKPLNEQGCILYPFHKWDTCSTGNKWNTKFDESLLEKKIIPLSLIHKNPWTALKMIKVLCFSYEEKVRYICPYTRYSHYWCLPLFIFCDDIKFWIDRINMVIVKNDNLKEKLENTEAIKKEFLPSMDRGLKFDKIQRTLLGSGITKETEENGGETYLYDTSLKLENNDFLGSKIWVWFREQ